MKDGYYLFAYLEINGFACKFNIETKRHDQNMSLWYANNDIPSLLRYWELERFSRIKHHNQAFSSPDYALSFIDCMLMEFNITHRDLVAIIGTPGLDGFNEKSINNSSCYNYHSLCHLFSSLLYESEYFYNDSIIAISADLDADYLVESKRTKKNKYVGSYSKCGSIVLFDVESPGALWSAASHTFKMGEGTLMALASALTSKFKKGFDFSKFSFFENNEKQAQSIINEIIGSLDDMNDDEKKNSIEFYDDDFSVSENVISCVMKQVQQLSFEYSKQRTH